MGFHADRVSQKGSCEKDLCQTVLYVNINSPTIVENVCFIKPIVFGYILYRVTSNKKTYHIKFISLKLYH